MANSDYYIQDNSDIEEKKLEAAKGLYQKGDYSGALKLYLDMVNMSYSHKLYYEIGRCYYKLNDYDNAESNFLRSISLEIYKNPSFTFLGSIYHKKEYIENAIEYWTVAHSFKPDDELVCQNLATAYFSKEIKLQSLIFFEKYLKYAKDKTSNHYLEIKKTMDEFKKIGKYFYKKALEAINANDTNTAIQCLEYAVKKDSNNFDINFLLGKLYYKNENYMQAMVYFRQAYCIDSKSLDVLEKLSEIMLIIGDYTGAYCCLKRILPLVINNQKEYLEIIRSLKQLEEGFDEQSYSGHELLANEYYSENNYHMALFEYENCVIINGSTAQLLDDKIQKIRSYINPEERIIKLCFEKGGTFYSTGDHKKANKYFSKIMRLADENSSDYKYAKARLMNV